MRVVFDTTALVSAIRSDSGAAAEIVRLILLGKLTLLLDYKLVSEYRAVALRLQHIRAGKKSRADAETIIDALENVATPVLVDVKYRPLSRDEDDDMVLDVAINGQADVLITTNAKDFAPAKDFAIRLLAPGEFLAEFRKRGFRHED